MDLPSIRSGTAAVDQITTRMSERNEIGDIVGTFGLSQNKHPHGFKLEDRDLSTWCAWDALFLPSLIGIPAKVTSTDPADGATGVPANSVVSATFNEAMDPASIGTSSFTLEKSGGAAVAGTVTYAAASMTATFTPDAELDPGADYIATITTGVEDEAGQSLDALLEDQLGEKLNPRYFIDYLTEKYTELYKC